MKKILFLFVCLISICLIYNLKVDDKITIFEISDLNISNQDYTNTLNCNQKIDKYIIYHNKYNYRVVDYLRDIIDNIDINYNNKTYSINSLLVKSKLIVLNIGNLDIKNIKSVEIDPYDYIDNLIKNYEDLLKNIRKESKENVVILYEIDRNDKYTDYYYNKLKSISYKHNCLLYDKTKLDKYIKNL